jgi:hypothetical protein
VDLRVGDVLAAPGRRPGTLLTLLDLYGVTDPARSDLVALARQSAE